LTSVKLTIWQVAVKSLLVYTSDQAGETMEKKSKVSISVNICIS
jgi:hypothetical protein